VESTRSERNTRYLWPLGLTAGYPQGGWELRENNQNQMDQLRIQMMQQDLAERRARQQQQQQQVYYCRLPDGRFVQCR